MQGIKGIALFIPQHYLLQINFQISYYYEQTIFLNFQNSLFEYFREFKLFLYSLKSDHNDISINTFHFSCSKSFMTNSEIGFNFRFIYRNFWFLYIGAGSRAGGILAGRYVKPEVFFEEIFTLFVQ